MRDIVATIQPEQDVIVRADVAETLCVQGAPGTGKTAVGLHRAAYLLYTFRDRLRRGGVLVVGPNSSFLSYISAVLPALGEVDVRQVTLEELVGARVEVRAVEPAAVAALKGDARMARVLDRAVHAGLREPTEPLVLPRGSRRWRVPAHELRDIVAELRARDVRYGAARAMLAQRLVARAADQDGGRRRLAGRPGAGRGRPQRAGAQGGRRAVAGRRPGAGRDDAAVRRGRTRPRCRRHPRPGRAGAAALGQAAARPEVRRRGPLADAVLVDEVADLVDREPSLGHVVLDEAQDLSPMQLRAVGRRCSTGVRDRARRHRAGHHPVGHHRLGTRRCGHLGKPDAHIEVLRRGYRVPAAVIEFAGRLLPHIAPGVSPPSRCARTTGASTSWQRSTWWAWWPSRYDGCSPSRGRSASSSPTSTSTRFSAGLGVEHVVLGATSGDAGVASCRRRLAKGLEYDHVVVVEPAAIVDGEPSAFQGLRRLYVVLTRAVSGLTVVHARPLPARAGGVSR